MRKFLGVLLMILGGFVGLGTIASFFSGIQKVAAVEPNFEYNSAYLFGTLIGAGMTGLIAYLFIYYGSKLFSAKKVE